MRRPPAQLVLNGGPCVALACGPIRPPRLATARLHVVGGRVAQTKDLTHSYSCSLDCFWVGVGAGDPLQMAPVKVTDTSVDRMVFDCPTWRSCFEGAAGKVHCLTGCHRQAQDNELQDILDRLRWGRAGARVVERVNATWSSSFTGTVTKLRIRKSSVQDINTQQLSLIDGPTSVFHARDVMVEEHHADVHQATGELRAFVDESLSLKVAASVILTRKVRDVPAGTRGVVSSITDGEIVGEAQTQRDAVVVCNFGGREMEVNPVRFSVYDAMGREVAFCEQLPLLLGWAITVHRSQGLTLDAVEIDFELDTWSTCGLVYTALSRVRSLSCLRVRGLRRDLIRVSRLAVAYYERKLQQNGIAPCDDGRPALES